MTTGYTLHVTDIPSGMRINLLSLEKAGYRQCFSNNLLTNDGKETIEDAVMLACPATVRGKVCDVAGKPVQGAVVVSAEGGLAARAVTDAAGAFTLPNQPAGELHLVAATPTSGGVTQCTAQAADVLITCQPGISANPNDSSLALALLAVDRRLQHPRRFNRADTIRAMADVDLELALQLSLTGNEPMPEGLRAYLLAKQAERDPSQVDKLLEQLQLLRDADCKLYAAVEIGIAVAKTDPGLAEQLYLIAKPLYDKSPHGRERHIEGLDTDEDISLRTLTLAALLHKTTELDAMLASLVTAIDHTRATGEAALHGIQPEGAIICPLFEAAGRVSLEFVCKVYNSIVGHSGSIDSGLVRAVTSLAQHDPAAAQRLIKMIVAHEGVMYVLAVPLINALGTQDPTAALALANTQPENAEGLLAAAAFQPKAAARKLIRTVFSREDSQVFINMEMIAHLAKANTTDPELGKELYTQYRQLLEAKSNVGSYADANRFSVEYAYLISSIDPVAARLIIETRYVRALGNLEHDNRYYSLDEIPLAMCALDPDRALAMLDALSKLKVRVDESRTRQRIMQYILMSREERASLDFFHWYW